MCSETCKCKTESNYAGCGCSSSFDNATGREKLKALVDKGKGLADKGKAFIEGMKSGSTNNTPPYTPPVEKESKTMLYLGIGAAVVIVIIIVIVVIKNR